VKKVIQTLFVGLLAICSIIYVSGNDHLFGLVAKVIETGRTTAGIDDYLFFDNRIIPPSDTPQAWPFHKDYNIVTSTPSLNALHDTLQTVAFLVIKNDSIWHEQYFDGYAKDSKSNSFSMAKSMVSASLFKAIEAGDVESENQKVIAFLPWLTGDHAKDVTMGDLASMASGLEWNENYDNLLTITPRTYVEKDMLSLMKQIPINHQPGEKFIYQSGSTQLLGLALEEATGENMSTLVRSYFWNPIGAEHQASWTLDSNDYGVEKSFCCLNSNARDFARFGKLFKNHGVWEEQQLIDSAFVEKSIRPRFEKSPQYGYGWWLGAVDESPFFSMRGHMGQYVIVFPEQDIIIVRLGHRGLNDIPGSQTPIDLPLYVKEVFKMIAPENET